MYRNTDELVKELTSIQQVLEAMAIGGRDDLLGVEANRLLSVIKTLSGSKNVWEIHSRFSPGEPDVDEVIRCESLEDAQTKLKELYENDLAQVGATGDRPADCDAYLDPYESHVDLHGADWSEVYADRKIMHRITKTELAVISRCEKDFDEDGDL